MASFSELTLLKSPFYLWDYTDAFAWSNFLVQRSGSTDSPSRRRLETVLVLDGVVGYADRIGVKETGILEHTVIGFVVTMGVSTCIFCAAAILARCYTTQRGDSRSAYRARIVMHRLLGLCWLLWFFSVYPLSVMASFEIWMEIYSKLFTPRLLALDVASLVGACLVMPAIAMRAVQRKTEEQLHEYKHIATFGAFYLDTRYSRRLFFMLWVLVQLAAGLSIGVLYTNDLLLGILIGIQVAYVFAVLTIRPFTDSTLRWMSLGASFLAITNFALGFAFLRTTVMPLKRRNAFADSFIGLNTGVILLWFVRHLVMFANAVRAILHRHEEWRCRVLAHSQPDVEMLKPHGQATSIVDPLTSREILPLVFRLGWSRSMSLSGSTSAPWANEISTPGAELTPRSTYATLSGA